MRLKPSLLSLAFVPLLAIAAFPARAAQPQVESIYGPLPVFEFHSGFWFNLHHTLFQEAKQRSGAPAAQSADPSRPLLKTAPGAKTALTPADQRIWDAAVAYYVENYANKDLLFTTELVLIKNQLGDFEDCDELSGTKKKTCDAGLPAPLTKVLESAAPIYRTRDWPDHDRANRRWIFSVAPLVREQGVGLSQRLADIYRTRWPRLKIRVDVSAYADRTGAYTTLDPLRVTISSTDPRNQGDSALEVLFHEASHGIAEPVEQAIARECRQRDKAIPRDLWHALIFYTTGEVIRPVLDAAQSSDPVDPAKSSDAVPASSYVPYAVREHLYQRGWDGYFKLLTKYWQPYLNGSATFDDAIARMVSSL